MDSRVHPDRSAARLAPAGDTDQPSREGGAALAMLECIRSPTCLIDASGAVTFLNQAWRTLSGTADDVALPFPWAQLIRPDDRYPALSRLRQLPEGDEPVTFECRLVDSGGRSQWFLLSFQPAGEAAGLAATWLCIATLIDGYRAREEKLRRLASIQTDMLNVSVDCIKLIATDGTLVHVNKAGCRALGIPEDSSFGMPWLPLLPEDVWEAGEKALAEARAGRFARFPGRSVVPGQKEQRWDNMLTPVIGGDGCPAAILCVSRDVSAEQAALASLRESEERLATAVRAGGLGIWDYDIQNDTLTCDGTWYRIMGRSPGHPVRSIQDFRPMIHPDDVERATDVSRTASNLVAENRDYAMVFRIIRPDGDVRWVRSSACLIQDARGVPVRAIGYVVDITDAWRGELALRDAHRALEREKQLLARASLEDPLTQLPNRRSLDNELARICRTPRERSGTMCVGMIDIDHFKQYNDRYGHVRGDEAIRKVAQTLQRHLRHNDFIARYGGEEFSFVLPDTEDPSHVVGRLVAAVAELAIEHKDSGCGMLTISCGCTVVPPAAHLSPEKLLQYADTALYMAKAGGRNQHATIPLS